MFPLRIQLAQKRLFDDTREAEKVLHFLESRSIGQIIQLTLPALVHTAILRVKVRIIRCCVLLFITSLAHYIAFILYSLSLSLFSIVFSCLRYTFNVCFFFHCNVKRTVVGIWILFLS